MQPSIHSESVLKRDAFSETFSAQLSDPPGTKVACRRLSTLPLWSRAIGRYLAGREARALHRVMDVPGCPNLFYADRDTLIRSWTDGLPLQLAKPTEAAFYRDAKRLLRDLRRNGVTHNDNAKPQNWLMTPEGRAALIDFQLASVHRRRGRLFRTMAREDLRHLLKQKRAFAPDLLTPAEHRMLARKSLPSRIWMATAKPLYNLITRRILHWSDGEGTEDKVDRFAPQIAQAMAALPGVTAHYTCACPLPGHGAGLYVFAETTLPEADLRAALPKGVVDHLQIVPSLPRDGNGQIDGALLSLIAMNQIEEVDTILRDRADLSIVVEPIVASRLNLTDRF